MNSSRESKYSVVDLFAGAGGLSYGFVQTGRYHIKAAFENNQSAQETYKNNHESTLVYNDVSDALNHAVRMKLSQVDVVIGGPPCQGFSNANRQKNHAISQNNSLVKKFVQVVLALNPKAFVMENVSMLQSNVHRFYVDEMDVETIKNYGIKTAKSEISLLDAEFLFPGVEIIAKDVGKISDYLWDDNDYTTLNAVFKTRNNPKKYRESLAKHKKKLLSLASNLVGFLDENVHIKNQANQTGAAIIKYFNGDSSIEAADSFCKAIEPAIMLQRMLSKAKEILENRIIVDNYSTENGLVAHVTSMSVIDYIKSIFEAPRSGYCINYGILSSADFGAPQKRKRFVLLGVKESLCNEVKMPIGTITEGNYRTVEDAIKDLQEIEVTYKVTGNYHGIPLPEAPKDLSELGKQLRDTAYLHNHVATTTTPEAMKRFTAIKQGNNFHSLPLELKTTYSDIDRTQNTIYLRLKYNEPSGTVVNVRKSMWIHPVKNRALSIREAARLQTFPDSFIFYGTKDSQYQQVGNAVPPMLAKAVAEHLYRYLVSGNNQLA